MSRTAPMGPVDYASTEIPSLYHCGKCGVRGVKLWREYNTVLDRQSLRCADCACAEQSKGLVRVDDKGRMFVGDERGDQIGWRIPAVPTEGGDTYWGYTSVPGNGVQWWKRLPLRKAQP